MVYHHFTGTNINTALDALTNDLVTGQPDYVNSADCQFVNVIMQAESCDYSFNIKKLWMTGNRWTSLVRQYIDPLALEVWLDMITDRIGAKKRGASFMRTQTVRSRAAGARGGVTRRWGSCIIGFGYRSRPYPELTMHSRTSYVGGLGQVDLGVAHHLAKLISDNIGVDLADIRFTWSADMVAFHNFKCLSWYFQDQQNRKWLIHAKRYENKTNPYPTSIPPTVQQSYREFSRVRRLDEEGVLYGDEKFSQRSRVRRHFHTEVFGYDYGERFEGGENDHNAKRLAPLKDFWVEDAPFMSLLKFDHGDQSNAEWVDDEPEAV